MKTLRIGLSPCPNDTFIFHALLEGIVELEGYRLEPVFEDVETLNTLARDGTLEITKISFHAYGHLRDSYQLLDAGSALGRGCGPLVVTQQESEELELSRARVAIPGMLTSANLLLRLFAPGLPPESLVELPFDQIMEAVRTGEVDAGLIIHESRFTYREYGLHQLVDLGNWWEEVHSHPIPIGGIIARRDLGRETIELFDKALGDSVRHARSTPGDSREFVRHHAQEMEDSVTAAHIDLYVNDFTVTLGKEGKAAVSHLLRVAEEKGIIPPSQTTQE